MTELRFDVGSAGSVSAIFLSKPHAVACLVFAHGAGAGMRHLFMGAVAEGLLARDIATLRFQFPYMEAGRKSPDRALVAQEAVRAAVGEAAKLDPGLPLFAGGKSFGGRMTSQAQAEEPLPCVRGLVFLGFPLHPASKPSVIRATHLELVKCPMLFLQGARDALADAVLMRTTVGRLGPRVSLTMIEDADHSFHVRASSGRADAEVLATILDRVGTWISDLIT